MKKIVLALNCVIVFSTIFSAFGMQIEPEKKKEKTKENIQSHFASDKEYIKLSAQLFKDFEWNNTGKINNFPFQQLILDKKAGKKIEYAYYAQKKIPLLQKPISSFNHESQNESFEAIASVNKKKENKEEDDFEETIKILQNVPLNAINATMLYPSKHPSIGLMKKHREHIIEKYDFEKIIKVLQDPRIHPSTAILFLRHPMISLDQQKNAIGSKLRLNDEQKLSHMLQLDSLQEKRIALNYYILENLPKLLATLALGAKPDDILGSVFNHIYSCQEHKTKNKKCSFHDSILSWTFNNYPCYTADNLCKTLFHYEEWDKKNFINNGKKIVKIINSHNLLQYTFEKFFYRSEFGHTMKPSKTMGLFLEQLGPDTLAYHIEQSKEFKKKLVGNATIETLLSLKQRRMTFNNPNLISIAEHQKNPLILSFILHEQKKLDEKPHTYFRRFLDINPDHKKLIFYHNTTDFSNNSVSHTYHTKVYSKMLDARYSRDMRPLENIVLSPDWPIWVKELGRKRPSFKIFLIALPVLLVHPFSLADF